MPNRLRHPNLRDKLNLLYNLRLNPSISRNADLARSLGITRQAINRWINGDMDSKGCSVPPDQLPRLEELFGVPESWFAEPLKAFSDKITGLANGQAAMLPVDDVGEVRTFTSMLPLTDAAPLGRERELDLLNKYWLTADCNLVQLVAFGGAGKTTIINAWLRYLALNQFMGAKRVFAWSFHWHGHGSEVPSSAVPFLEGALEWFGDPQSSRGTAWSKAHRLARRVRQNHTLLILDGLEVLQAAPGVNGGEVTDAALAMFLRELISGMNGCCLVTSRIEIPDIGNFYGRSIRTIPLRPLDQGAAVELLRRHGLSGHAREFHQAAASCRGHALSLNLLAGYMNSVNEGRLNYWADTSKFLGDCNQLLPEHDRIMRAYARWFQNSDELTILYLVSLYTRPVGVQFLQRLTNSMSDDGKVGEIAALNLEEWKLAVRKLLVSQLVTAGWRDHELVLDMHPMVRNYFSTSFRSNALQTWKRCHMANFEILVEDSKTAMNRESSQELLFQAVMHGCMAGDYHQAFALYESRIKQGQVSMFNMGSHHADLACLRLFFLDPWDRVVDELPESARCYLVSCAAANLVTLGRIDEALSPFGKSIEGLIKQKDLQRAIIASGALVSMQLYVGNLEQAFAVISRIESIAATLDNPIIRAVIDNYIGHACFLSGNLARAGQLFADAEAWYLLDEPPAAVNFPMVSCFHTLFLIETGNLEKAVQRAQLALSWRQRGSWQVRFDTTTLNAMDNLALGLAYLRSGMQQAAEPYLEAQVEMLRAVDDWLFLPFGLCYRSEFHIATGNFEAASADLEEAVRIARNTGARVLLRDAYMGFCRLKMREGDRDAVKLYFDLGQSLGLEEHYLQRSELRNELDRYLAEC